VLTKSKTRAAKKEDEAKFGRLFSFLGKLKNKYLQVDTFWIEKGDKKSYFPVFVERF